MTERKPQEISFASWVDQQIAEAADRGAFDDLPGAGKPIPRRGGTEAWLQDYLRREGVSADELLPTPLRLRKEVERLAETVGDLRSEDEVREVVRGLNRRILEWRRIPTGPPIYLRLAGEEAMVARWREAQPGPPPAPPARPPRDTSSPHRRRWRRRQALRPGSRSAYGRTVLRCTPPRITMNSATAAGLGWPPRSARCRSGSWPGPPAWSCSGRCGRRPAVRTVAVSARRMRAGWRSARRPAAPPCHGREWAGRCRRRLRG